MTLKSTFETPRFAVPVYRHGAVISTTSSTEGQNVTLDARDSRRLGDLIVRSKHLYIAAWSHALEGRVLQVSWEDSPCRVRVTPGVVIDFPKFKFSWTTKLGVSMEVLARPCVTVCLSKSRSKIWFRFLLRDYVGVENGYRNVDDFFELSAQINDVLQLATTNLYGQQFSEVFNKLVNMKPAYAIKFFVGDYLNAESPEAQPEAIFGRLLQIGDDLQKVAPANSARQAREADYYVHEGRQGDRGVFITSIDASNAVFRGVCLSDRGQGDGQPATTQQTAFFERSAALGMTAELCNIFAQDL